MREGSSESMERARGVLGDTPGGSVVCKAWLSVFRVLVLTLREPRTTLENQQKTGGFRAYFTRNHSGCSEGSGCG